MANNLANQIFDFINGNFEKDTDKEQELAMAFADRQHSTILGYIKLLRARLNVVQFTLCDYGCGMHGNLFYYLNRTYSDSVKYIDYFGFNKKNVEYTSEYEKVISNYQNVDKNFNSVFFDLEHIGEIPEIKADIVILKNVLHEVPLEDLPQLLANVNNLIGIEKYLIIYEFEDFIKCESDRFPYRLIDLIKLFIDTLGYIKEEEFDDSVPEEYRHINTKTQLSLLIVKKDPEMKLFDIEDLKSKIYRFFDERLIEYDERIFEYNRKKSLGIELSDIEKYDFPKYNIYYTNISRQLRRIAAWQNTLIEEADESSPVN